MKQVKKLNAGGSLINNIMANNSTIPVVGKGATILSYSDRHAYEVISVNKKGDKCFIQEYDAKRIDKNGMSESQEYEYKKLINDPIEVVFRYGKWRIKGKEITLTKEFLEEAKENGHFISANHMSQDLREKVYGVQESENWTGYPINVVEGITKARTTYLPINIIFGVKDKYYDFTF